MTGARSTRSLARVAPEAKRARPERPVFRPRFTLMMLYLFGFFLLFALLFVAPRLAELVALAGELPPEELERRAFEASRGAFAGRFYWAAGLAVLATGVAAWTRALPGLR